MVVRAVWRPSLQVWALVGFLALALVEKVAPARLHGHGAILTPALILVGILVIRRLWELNPAINMCGAIVLTIFSGAWFQIGLGGLPLDRLMALLVLLQLLLRAPGVAHTPRIDIRNVHLLMCLTVIYVLASAIAAKTITTESGILTVFDTFGITPYLMFLVAPTIFSGQRERNMLLATLVGLGAYLGFTAIFESLGPHSLVFPSYIARVDTELPGERAGGPFQSSVTEGFATYACAVTAAMAFAHWRGRARRYIAAVVAIVCIFGCFLTLERGVWLAAMIATAITALATRTGRRWLVPATITCALVIGSALIVSPALSHKASDRASDETSVWSRENQTSAALRMLAAKPIVGFGLARYKTDSLEYFRQPETYPQNGYSIDEGAGTSSPVLPLHDTYLAFAVELGVVGATLWLASLLWGVGSAIFARGRPDLRPWKLGLMAIAIFYLVVAFIDPHEQAFPPFLLWTWAGVAFGGLSLSSQAAEDALRSSRAVFGAVATTSSLGLEEVHR